jgi:probable HAF family extracellular repeat protein
MFTAVSVHGTMGKGAARRWRALWLAWVVVAWAAQPSLAQRLIWLGTLPGSDRSWATGVSADGSVVVGWADNAKGRQRAFRWTAARGMEDLGTLGGDSSWALGVSADGSVVVGWAANAAGYRRAFRWTAARGMEDLGTLGGDESEALGVSADGSVVVGGLTGVPFAGRRRVGCRTSARWAAIGARLLAFPPMAPWWSAGLRTPQRSVVPFAGRRRVGWKTSARWAAMRARLWAFPPMAPWWSAGLKTPQGSSCLSLDGGGWDAGPRHAAGQRWERGFWRFRRWLRGGRLG